jgi:hypothetical protein
LRLCRTGEPLGDEPEWLDGFREEYAAYKARETNMYRLPTVNDFARVLALLKQYGLTGRPARQLAYKLSDCG